MVYTLVAGKKGTSTFDGRNSGDASKRDEKLEVGLNVGKIAEQRVEGETTREKRIASKFRDA